MSVEVLWSGLKKAAREDSWVFEVVPLKDEPFDEVVFDEAAEAANEIHQEDIDRFNDGNLLWRFPTPAGIGFWCEYGMSSAIVKDFFGVLVAEMESRGMSARIRAVRQSHPKAFYEEEYGLSLAMVLNDDPEARNSDGVNYEWVDDPDARSAVVELLLDWCNVDEAKFWAQHSMNCMKIDANKRRDLITRYSKATEDGTELTAENSAGQYRHFKLSRSGGVILSVGPIDDNNWRDEFAELEQFLVNASRHIVYGGIVRGRTGLFNIDYVMRNVWHTAGGKGDEMRLPRVWQWEHHTAFVLGIQVLNPAFHQPKAQDGWTLTNLEEGRLLLKADNSELWFGKFPSQELLFEALRAYPDLTVLDIEQLGKWRVTLHASRFVESASKPHWWFAVGARDRTEDPDFGLLMQAATAANVIYRDRAEEFHSNVLDETFLLPNAVGFWVQEALEASQLEQFLDVFRRELEALNLHVDMRFQHLNLVREVPVLDDGICLIMIPNTLEGDESPEGSLLENRRHVEGFESIFKSVMEWGLVDSGSGRVTHAVGPSGIRSSQYDVRNLLCKMVDNLEYETEHSWTGYSSSDPEFDTQLQHNFRVTREGVFLLSVGANRRFSWKGALDLLVPVMMKNSHFLQYAAITRSSTRPESIEHWLTDVWVKHGGITDPVPTVAPEERGHKAGFVAAAQVLGPGFAKVEAQEGWDVMELEGDRQLLIAKNIRPWIVNHANAETLLEASSLFPEIVGK